MEYGFTGNREYGRGSASSAAGSWMSVSRSALYLVPTPLGNAGDITLRALHVLENVGIIACENRKRALSLLDIHQIKPKRLLVCQADNEEASAQGILKLLGQGESVAYISDAGTPTINDPGGRLAQTVRAAGFKLEVLPGPSALTLLASSYNTFQSCNAAPFSFIGFLPSKPSKRRKALSFWLGLEKNFVFYESAHRLCFTLSDLQNLAPGRELFMGKEMTKKSEEFFLGSTDDILDKFKNYTRVNGEFTLLVTSPKSRD